MSELPVHLQRRFEQRWASRFVLKNVGTKATISKLTTHRAVAATTEDKPGRGEGTTVESLTAPDAVTI
jgi:hypothetical protein